jgi:hypothetical protein
VVVLIINDATSDINFGATGRGLGAVTEKGVKIDADAAWELASAKR